MNDYSNCNNKDFQLNFTKKEVQESQGFNTILSSSNCHAEQKVFWTLSGKGISANDFINQSLKGSETLNSQGIYKHKIFISGDKKKEAVEMLTLEYFVDKKRTNKVAEKTIKIIDIPHKSAPDNDQDLNKPYRLQASRPQVKENVHISVNIQNGIPGKTVYFSLSGKGINKNDFNLNYARMKGEAMIQSNGIARLPFLLRADHNTEGEETATVSLYKDKNRTKKLNSISFPIADTSIETPKQGPTDSINPGTKQPQWGPVTPKGTWFTLSPSRSEINENNSTRTRIDSNSEKNRRLYFKLSGKGINKNDIDLSYARTSGQAITNSKGVALIPHLLRNDNKTEGTEEMTISLYSDKKMKRKLAATTVPILDTSVQTPEQGPTKSQEPGTKQTPWPGDIFGGSWFTLSPNHSEYRDNEPILTRIDSDSLPGETVYYQLSGAGITSSSLGLSSGLGGLKGKASIGLNGLANIEHVVKEDATSFKDRELTIDLYRDRKRTKKVASTNITIKNITVRPETKNTISSSEGAGRKQRAFDPCYIPANQDFCGIANDINANDIAVIQQNSF